MTRPTPPDALVGALQDRAHAESGRVRAAKRVWREGFPGRVAAAEALLSGTAEDEPTPLDGICPGSDCPTCGESATCGSRVEHERVAPTKSRR